MLSPGVARQHHRRTRLIARLSAIFCIAFCLFAVALYLGAEARTRLVLQKARLLDSLITAATPR